MKNFKKTLICAFCVYGRNSSVFFSCSDRRDGDESVGLHGVEH